MAGRPPTLDEWAENARTNANPQEFRRALLREMSTLAIEARGQALRLATSRLRVRTGKLRQSIGSGARVRRERVEAYVSADTPYAATQEMGATIRPKRGRYLTIPLGPAMTAAGVTRQTARSMPGLFVYRSQSGNLFLARKKQGGGIELVWLLRRQVTIRGKHYLRDGMKRAAADLPASLRSLLARTVEVG